MLSTLSSRSALIGQSATKVCGKCGVEKPVDSFQKEYGVKLRPECKECARKLNAEVRNLHRLYGHTRPNECDICHKDKKLNLDHDHKTGAFRGWLCKDCNIGLSDFNDSIELIDNAKLYLLKSTKPCD